MVKWRRSQFIFILISSYYACVMGIRDTKTLENVAALKLHEIQKLLSTPAPAKGTSFPTISGPKSTSSRIAILGAGPAGIHMAYKLKVLGYTDVVILETGSRIGGKSWTVYHRGVRHEMGIGHFSLENEDILSLIRDFHDGPISPLGGVSIWPDKNGSQTLLSYLLFEIGAKSNITDSAVAMDVLSGSIQRYIRLHRKLFGDYKGELMARPRPNVMKYINGTIAEFLRQNNLEILENLFRIIYSAHGYGHLDDRPALYGLMHVTPRRLQRVMESFIDPENSNDNFILEQGLSSLWSDIVDKAKLRVKLNQNISYIIRTPGQINVYSNDLTETSKTKIDMFDFLIISDDMLKTMSILDTSWIERQIFTHLVPSFITSSLIDTNFGKRGSMPRAYFMFNMRSSKGHSVWSHEDSYSILQNIHGTNYSRGLISGGYDGQLHQSIVVRQYGESYPSIDDINTGFLRHAEDFGITHGYVLARKIWTFFPRFSQDDVMSGLIWDIFTLQGHKNTWYIGPSVCFDSLSSVMGYNKLVLKQFKNLHG